jgi:hypothetical protein
MCTHRPVGDKHGPVFRTAVYACAYSWKRNAVQLGLGRKHEQMCVAGVQQLWLGRSMDGAIHAVTAQQCFVCCIDNGIDIQRSDVVNDYRNHQQLPALQRPKCVPRSPYSY